MSVRRPAVAGSFYPSDPEALSKMVDACYKHRLGPGTLPPAKRGTADIVSFVAPHAGYEYSGPVAAHSYLWASSLPDPEVAVVVAPNHYGLGSGVSSSEGGEWETPLGRMKVDGETARALAEVSGLVDFDPAAHRLEHSLEVQLPFIQKLYGPSVQLVPLSLGFQDEETATTLGKGVATVLRGKKALLIASSDLSHYEPAEQAKTKDLALVREIESMDVGSFYSTLERLRVTACGFGAIATVIEASRALGLTRGELLKYASSGDTTGDYAQVVGYSSVRFT